MAISMKEVRNALDPDEPDYKKASRLGADALSHLKKLVKSDDPLLASKAAYLAGRIAADGSADVLRIAAQSADPILRIAAASAAPFLRQREQASEILSGLLADQDTGVCRIALSSVGPWASEELREHVKSLSQAADQPMIRTVAKKALKTLKIAAPAKRATAKKRVVAKKRTAAAAKAKSKAKRARRPK